MGIASLKLKFAAMIAIVDCNSFYCSCERLFRPELAKKPVVVLSNNDGCIISRTDEAKKLGVAMAGPYFMAKPIIDKHEVACFSSNYNLYGDMSWRVMETLRVLVGAQNVEVYSVDEAFVNLTDFSNYDLQAVALKMRMVVEQWTGIKVSIGIAPTKLLAKVANHLAKKQKLETKCVVVLKDEDEIADALMRTPVDEIWGIGRRYADKLKSLYAIYTAYDLSKQNEEWCRVHLGGVVGSRLLRELKGLPAIGMEEELIEKKRIATTRMFGKPVTSILHLKEAVATYTARAAEKLRRQHSAAGVITVFVVPKEQQKNNEHFRHGPVLSSYATLTCATANTGMLTKVAVSLVDSLYKPNASYKKAGVMLSSIVPDSVIQGSIFGKRTKENRQLMEVIDNINFSMRNDILKYAACGTTQNWKMRAEMRSPRYTTRWGELYTIN